MIKQYRITAGNFTQSAIPDTVLDSADLQQLQQLVGIPTTNDPLVKDTNTFVKSLFDTSQSR